METYIYVGILFIVCIAMFFMNISTELIVKSVIGLIILFFCGFYLSRRAITEETSGGILNANLNTDIIPTQTITVQSKPKKSKNKKN